MLLNDQATQENLSKQWAEPVQPEAPSFSAWSFTQAGMKGPAAGLIDTAAFGADVFNATGGALYRAALSLLPEPKVKQGFDEYLARERANSMQTGSVEGAALRAQAESLAPNPETATTADQVIFGLTRGVSKAAGYIGVGGIAGGGALFGLEEAQNTAQNLVAKGVDQETAYTVGGVTGVASGASVFIPGAGQTLLQTAGLIGLTGPGIYMAQEKLTKDVLQEAGYKAEADLHNPLDPLGLALSIAIPTVAGGLHLRGVAKRAAAIEKGGVTLEAMTPTERKALKYDAPQLDAYAEKVADAYGVPPDILLAVKNAGEKSGSTATSPKGAKGVMQFMAATAKEMGVKDPTDPIQAIDGGARYLRKLYDAYGSWDAAVAHYNGGGREAALVRAGKEPGNAETLNYLKRVREYVSKRAAERGGKDQEVVDAARVKVSEDHLAQTLPDTPTARADVLRAADEIAAGRMPEVAPVTPDQLPFDGFKRRIADQLEGLQSERAELVAASSEMLDPGMVRTVRADLRDLQARAPDSSDAAVRELAKQIQDGERISYKAALSSAKKQISQLVEQHEGATSRLQTQLDQHARGQQAFDQIAKLDREIDDLSQRMAALPGPNTAPTRLASAISDAFRNDAAQPIQIRNQLARPSGQPNALPPAGESFSGPDVQAGGAQSAAAATRTASAEQPSALPTLDAMRMEQIAAETPDLKVMLPGQDAPMSVAEALELAKAEAQEIELDAELFKAAMLCALENGAAAVAG